MSLLEHEATRMAAALDDYEHVLVTDIGGTESSGYWLCVTGEQFGLSYEIGSHYDYWDFLTSFVWLVPTANSGEGRNGRLSIFSRQGHSAD